MGEAIDRLVQVMDTLRSPGGCPWDADQTHTSLMPYLLEESHELAEAVDAGDRTGLREELGDVLLQVVFHARIAQEDQDDPFDLEDLAAALTAKLVRRHPHVFAEAPIDDGGIHAQWDRLKRVEKPERTSALDGVPVSLPALSRAQKIASRARRADLDPVAGLPTAGENADEALGAALLELAVRHSHVDAEGALRRAVGRWERSLRAAEAADGEGPGRGPGDGLRPIG